MNPENIAEVIVQRFTPKPGEVVVLSFPRPLTQQQANTIKDAWHRLMPDVRCVVMSDGGHVSGVVSGEAS